MVNQALFYGILDRKTCEQIFGFLIVLIINYLAEIISRTVVDIHFFFNSLIDIISLHSNNFDLIFVNCTKNKISIIFTCITQYFCCYDPRIPKIQRQFKFSLNFSRVNLSFFSKFLSVLAKIGKQMMTNPERLVILLLIN